MGRTATEMDEFFRAPKKEEYEETKDTLEFLRRADREKKQKAKDVISKK